MSRFQTSFETSPLLPFDDAEEHNVFNAGHGSQNASPESPALCNAPVSSQRALVFRIGAAMYSFIVLGLFTSSLGIMLPHLESYYRLTDTHVSLIFLVGPIGYILAAQSTESIHRRFGQRGIALLGPFFHFFPAAVISTHPPFWIVLIGYAIVTFGTGLLDSSWCAWAGGMGERANTVSGMLHGSFSVGAAVGPLLAGMLIDPGNKPWWNWYYMLTGASLLEVVVLPLAFRYEDAIMYCQKKHGDNPQTGHPPTIKTILRYRAIWISSVYFLAYVGTESAISGWIVSFLTRARGASTDAAALSLSGFWTGMAIGRLSLGVVTDYLGVARATTMYLSTAITLEILLAVFPSVKVSIALATGLGFIMGPLFPSGIVLLTSLLPKETHITAVSFVASIGQIGGALLPFVIGATVQGLGIQIFKYVVVVQLSAALGIWLVILGIKGEEAAEEELDDDETEE